MADAAQFEKVRSIVTSDESRRVVVVSAAGKRYKDDHKVTDLLYLCYAHLQYGVSCDGIYQMICDRYLSIRDELGLRTDLEGEFAALRRKMDQGISQDELVSRGEYFAAKLMADYLGFDFLDSTMWLKFRLDGSVDQEASYEALQHAASGRRVVMPGFYGVMPDGAIKTFTRGGSDITGALAAAALDADVYENWTDVSGFLMADPRIVEDPQPIERITYSELRELSYIGAQVLHEGTIFPVREKNIPLNIRNTNQPDNPGTMIRESFDETEQLDHRFITGIAGRKHFSVITITKTGMSSENGSLRRILEISGNAVEVGALVLEDSIGGFPGYYCEQAGFACYHPPIELLTDENVRDCKEHGVKMNVWTVNDMAGLEQLHRWGCEGIITNYPGVASGWLRAQGE